VGRLGYSKTACVRRAGRSAGDAELPGLTDEEKPRMRGPKRASKIRKLFNLGKDDDVRKYVNTYRRVITKGDKTHSKAPKIQRLVTPLTLQRKRRRRAIKRERITTVRAAVTGLCSRPCVVWHCCLSCCWHCLSPPQRAKQTLISQQCRNKRA